MGMLYHTSPVYSYDCYSLLHHQENAGGMQSKTYGRRFCFRFSILLPSSALTLFPEQNVRWSYPLPSSQLETCMFWELAGKGNGEQIRASKHSDYGLVAQRVEICNLVPTDIFTLTQSKWTNSESPGGGVSLTAGEQGRKGGKAIEEHIWAFVWGNLHPWSSECLCGHSLYYKNMTFQIT